MNKDITTLVGNRQLQDPSAIGQENALSYVAVPTYAAPQNENDKSKPCYVAQQTLDVAGGRCQAVIVDSVQSQANRVEERLSEIFSDTSLVYPRISVPFPDGTILTNWNLSHRSADQILRLTNYFDNPVRRFKSAPAFLSPYQDLTYFLEKSPIDVILGVWHAHRGPTLKLPRLLSATMMGYTPVVAAGFEPSNRISRGSQKIDPLVTGQARVVKQSYKSGQEPRGFSEEIVGFDFSIKGKDDEKLSAAGLGDVPSGVIVGNSFAFEKIQQRVTLALAPLRNAHFPLDGKIDAIRDAAGRDVLIALGMIAFRAALEIDGLLRSGALLTPVSGKTKILSVDRLGVDKSYDLPSMEKLLSEYSSAIKVAQKHGFVFDEFVATPHPALIELYAARGKQINRSGDIEEAA